MITVSSATTSQGKGAVRGSGTTGTPGTTAKAAMPNRISNPEAAGSRRDTQRGSQ